MPPISLNDALTELSYLAATTPFRLSNIVDNVNEEESYFYCIEGFVVRVLRSGDISEASRPAYIQFFDFDGHLIKNYVKHHEASALFFNRFSARLNHSQWKKLASKPSFIEPQNIYDFRQIVSDSPWKKLTTCCA